MALIGLKLLAECWLEWINERHVKLQGDEVPTAFKETMDTATYQKSVRYTAAKSRLSRWETVYGTLVLIGVLFSGLLPWSHRWFTDWLGGSAWGLAAYLMAIGLLLSFANLPFGWYSQFGLEERFGFNNTTTRLWWADRGKGLALSLALGYPLLVLILKIMEWTGAEWWLWAWGCLLAFQFLMWILAPVCIMPLFNKFTPLPAGPLRDGILQLAERTGFQASQVQVMDGSKRSRHSNAFFTGFGRFRKIVLFDTLIQQLSIPEMESVLAHEIGHYQKRHLPKMFAASAAGSLVGFYLIAWLADQAWFCQSFGFTTGNQVVALLLFVLLSGVVTFWLSPLINAFSRRYEYQADAFAARTMGAAQPLVASLRKLAEKNLSNLTPHPWYSGFYYSHPTLLEREAALAQIERRCN